MIKQKYNDSKLFKVASSVNLDSKVIFYLLKFSNFIFERMEICKLSNEKLYENFPNAYAGFL